VENIDYPALYREAGAASVSSQRSFLFAIKAHAALSILAALLAVYAPVNRVSAILAAFFFLVLMGVSLWVLFGELEGSWYKARAVAESVKTMTWRFIMRVEPFQDDDSAESLFRDRLRQSLEDSKEIQSAFSGEHSAGTQITDAMRDLRRGPLETRKRVYLSGRIEDQQNWYKAKAARNNNMDK